MCGSLLRGSYLRPDYCWSVMCVRVAALRRLLSTVPTKSASEALRAFSRPIRTSRWRPGRPWSFLCPGKMAPRAAPERRLGVVLGGTGVCLPGRFLQRSGPLTRCHRHPLDRDEHTVVYGLVGRLRTRRRKLGIQRSIATSGYHRRVSGVEFLAGPLAAANCPHPVTWRGVAKMGGRPCLRCARAGLRFAGGRRGSRCDDFEMS